MIHDQPVILKLANSNRFITEQSLSNKIRNRHTHIKQIFHRRNFSK